MQPLRLRRRDLVLGSLAALAAQACRRSPEASRGASSSSAPAQKDSTMHVAFVAHGAPLLALDPERGAPYAAWGRATTRPRAILAVSAHWQTRVPTLGTLTTRPLLYDFYGFPKPLYEVKYEAPGAPELARRVAALIGPEVAVPTEPTRALDHGVWTPLVHLYPAADVPVLQLSLPSPATGADLVALGRKLAPLRDEGVLVMGSGNVTHNLRRVDWEGKNPPPSWAADFDAWTTERLTTNDVDGLADYERRAPALDLAHPTREHFEPLLVVVGAASLGDARASFPVTGWEFGTLSRRSVQLG